MLVVEIGFRISDGLQFFFRGAESFGCFIKLCLEILQFFLAFPYVDLKIVKVVQDYIDAKGLVSVPESDVLRGLLGIFSEPVYTALDLRDDVSYAVEVYRSCLEFVLSFRLAALIEHDSGCFFKYLPSVLRLCADYIGDLSLSDD